MFSRWPWAAAGNHTKHGTPRACVCAYFDGVVANVVLLRKNEVNLVKNADISPDSSTLPIVWGKVHEGSSLSLLRNSLSSDKRPPF